MNKADNVRVGNGKAQDRSYVGRHHCKTRVILQNVLETFLRIASTLHLG